MVRSREVVAIDRYVLEVLMRDLIGHDHQPGAFLVYLHLHGQAACIDWKPVAASLRLIAEATGLSKSAVQTAMQTLHRRGLIQSTRIHATAVPTHSVLRPWRR
jgi:DNA-binding MarR family transcriptional regulator